MDACPGVSGAHGRAAPAHSSPPGNAALESEEKLSLGSGMVGCNKETTLNDAHPAAGTATAALSAAGSFTQAWPEKQLPPEVIAPPHTAPEGDLPYLYPGVGGAGGAPTTVGPMVVSTARSGRWTAKARVTSADASAAAPNGARDGSSSAAGRQVLGDLPHELALAGLAVLAAATSHGAGAGPPTNTGHWNIDERRLYEEALTTVGARQWEAIAKHVGTRDPTQARTHAVRTRPGRGAEGGRGGVVCVCVRGGGGVADSVRTRAPDTPLTRYSLQQVRPHHPTSPPPHPPPPLALSRSSPPHSKSSSNGRHTGKRVPRSRQRRRRRARVGGPGSAGDASYTVRASNMQATESVSSPSARVRSARSSRWNSPPVLRFVGRAIGRSSATDKSGGKPGRRARRRRRRQGRTHP